ncbi:MAG: SAM-dependent methyltransferase, partial [bacterium]
MTGAGILPGSFRDPSGFIFKKDNRILRQINESYARQYTRLFDSGLYDCLTKKNLLIPHKEVALELAYNNRAFKVIEPEKIDFIAYPYEFCFSQLKDAALTTIQIQKMALDKGMTLKDASAYNIQFHKGKPLLIDTLSFDIYDEGGPWIAYRQFCQHFLAPLLLMSYKDIRLAQLLRVFIDGLPLDMVSRLLPRSTYLKFSILTHVHLHAKSQKKYESGSVGKIDRKISLRGMKGLIDNLESTIERLRWKHDSTEWGDYYDDTNYSKDALDYKLKLIDEYLDEISPRTVWDIGANTGFFS